MALDDITTPLDELERQIRERAIAAVSDTPEDRHRNRRALNKSLASPRHHHAVDAMIWRGMSVEDAAKHARCRIDHLRKALRQPVMIQYLKEGEAAVRRGYRLQALHRTNELAQSAESEHVRLGANKALLPDPELKAPGAQVNVNVGMAVGAGYVIRPGMAVEGSGRGGDEPVVRRPGMVIDCSQPDPRRELAAKQQAEAQAALVEDPHGRRFTTEPDR